MIIKPTLYILVDYICNRGIENPPGKNTQYYINTVPVAEDGGVSGSLYDAGPTAVC